MCGIAGLIDTDLAFAPSRREAIAVAMADRLRHRGPDGGGVLVDGAVALAQRRLAIQDVSPAGAQPMVSASGRHVIVYNGELYALDALRREVEARGVVLRGRSDTEVLLESAEAIGLVATLERLAGIFALALFDRETRTTTLARDPFGVKPLALARIGRGWAFASELTAFEAVPGFDPPVDPDALAALLRYACVPAPATIFSGVEKVPPGGLVTIAADGSVRRSLWFDLDRLVARGRTDPIGDFDAAVEATAALVDRVVADQLVSDVPLGAFLSGGIDSSLVVAAMGAAGPRPKTFTIGFRDAAYDESAAAAAVAAHLGTEHETLMLDPGDIVGRIAAIVAASDEPFADSSLIPTRIVSELARRHVTVALSGDGGDEAFRGYNRHLALPAASRLLDPLPKMLRGALAGVLDAAPGRVERIAGALPAQVRPRLVADKLRKLAVLANAPDLAARYDAVTAHWPPDHGVVRGGRAATAWSLPSSGDALDAIARADMGGYMPDDVLTKVDRASMAVGLEARVPLLDQRLVALSWRIPGALHTRGGKGKAVLRAVLARRVPPPLFERPKAGFAVPIGAWLRGPLRDMADAHLDAAGLEAAGLDAAAVRAVWAEHLDGRRDRAHLLWPVLALRIWQGARADRGRQASPASMRA